MPKQQILSILKIFQNSPKKSKLRSNYFGMFEKIMTYRTTKSENPGVTLKMVEKVLYKSSAK